MRGLSTTLVVLAAFTLAGCASSPPAAPDEPRAPNQNTQQMTGETTPGEVDAPPLPHTVLEGTYPWNPIDPADPLEGYVHVLEFTGQTVLTDCINETEGTLSAWNLVLPTVALPMAVPAFEVTMTWEPTEYIHDSLVLAYKSPATGQWHESPYIENGATTIVVIESTEGAAGGSWEFGVCLSRNPDHLPVFGDYRPVSFSGDLDVTVSAVEASA